jgi:hypothetical protein
MILTHLDRICKTTLSPKLTAFISQCCDRYDPRLFLSSLLTCRYGRAKIVLLKSSYSIESTDKKLLLEFKTDHVIAPYLLAPREPAPPPTLPQFVPFHQQKISQQHQNNNNNDSSSQVANNTNTSTTASSNVNVSHAGMQHQTSLIQYTEEGLRIVQPQEFQDDLPFLPVEFTTLGENEMDAQSRINVRCS